MGADRLKRRPAVRQRDLQRVLTAFKAAGLEIARVEIDPTGKICIVTKEGSDESPTSALDAWVAADARAS